MPTLFVGNFHIAPGRSYQQGAMHMHDVSTFSEIEGVESFDFSHRINKLTFGQEYPVRLLGLAFQ